MRGITPTHSSVFVFRGGCIVDGAVVCYYSVAAQRASYMRVAATFMDEYPQDWELFPRMCGAFGYSPG